MQDQIVVIPGGAGGLGAGVCGAFLEAGARVIVADRKPPAVSGAAFRETDLLSEDGVRALAQAVEAEHGRIDVLVNLVGGFVPGAVAESQIADLDRMYQLNLRPVFTACRYVLPGMYARRAGKVVNVGARPGVAPVPGLAAYAALKAAVVHLTEVLAAESVGMNVQVNAVLPSVIDTAANRAAMPEADPARWVRPESLGRVIRFLCSADAGDVSGAVVPVYGKS